MSTGKRLAKRSIIGTRVCARGEDGFYYPGIINAVKTPGNNPTAPLSETRYTVRFDQSGVAGLSSKREFRDLELIGPGFQTMHGLTLLPAQKVYITYNGREISGRVISHQTQPDDEVVVSVSPPGMEGDVEVHKRLEEVRLTECRKSARLQDQQDTDYSRLADMAGDRKRLSSHYIDVPQGSRKRRPSTSQDENKEDLMDECTAALVLMHLSCSPHSPNGNASWIESFVNTNYEIPDVGIKRRRLDLQKLLFRVHNFSWMEPLSPEASLSDACSGRSNTPSPPLSEGATSNNWLSASDEGIVLDDDFDELPKKKKALLEVGRGWHATETSIEVETSCGRSQTEGFTIANRMVYQCTWPKCNIRTTTCHDIEAHVRNAHLGPRMEDEGMEGDDHEEEFYYTEVEYGMTSPPPTLSHRDMARPPHEDPEYQKALGLNGQLAGSISIPNSFNWPITPTLSPGQKQMKLSVSAPSGKLPGSPSRRIRGDTKKCRKVYGMEHRELWCTQCKWKKACTRFGD